jgi:hypothetical protein
LCLCSGDRFPDVLVVDHDPKFTSQVFRAFIKSMGLCLIFSSAYHKNTNTKVEQLLHRGQQRQMRVCSTLNKEGYKSVAQG